MSRRASVDAAAPSAAGFLPLSRSASLPHQPQLGSAGSSDGHRERSPPPRQSSSQGLPPAAASLPRRRSDSARDSSVEAQLLSPGQRRSSASDAAGGFPALGDSLGAGSGSSGRSTPGLPSAGGKLKRSASEAGGPLVAPGGEREEAHHHEPEREREQEPPSAPAPTDKLGKDDVLR